MPENDTMSPEDIQSLKTSVFNVQVVSDTSTAEGTAADNNSNNGNQPPDTGNNTPPDINAILKETFGVDDLESAKITWAELQALKNAPPKIEKPTYNNETSRLIHEHLEKGNLKEVKSYLDGQEILESLATMNEEQKLKMFIKMQYPAYGNQDVLDAKYKKTYSFDDSEFKDINGDVIDPTGYGLAKAEAEQKKVDDLEKAAQYFERFKEKIKLPSIQEDKQADPDAESYRQLKAQDDKEAEFIVSQLSKLTENDLSFIAKFEDKDNKGLVVDAVITPDKADFDLAKQAAQNFWGFVNATYKDKDGSINVKELVQDILFGRNKEKYAQSFIKQGTVEALRWHIAQNKPSTDMAARNYSTQEPNELEDLRQQVFKRRNGVPA